MSKKDKGQHQAEIQKNLLCWQNKPVLKFIYSDFYRLIRDYLNDSITGPIIELGSGTGNIKTVIPDAICTDLFENPWIDRIENAYNMTLKDSTASNIILFDVFHHLEYPGSALAEFHRVLKTGGRVIVFDPALSMTGLIVYGLLHHEPLAVFKGISWLAPEQFEPWTATYHAAQSNAEKVFFGKRYRSKLAAWDFVTRKKYAAFTYILSGGYSKPQLFPSRWYKQLKKIEKYMDGLPFLFGTRALIVLQKK